MKTRTHVKPAKANDPAAGWLVTEETTLQSFCDDLHRYGLRVALYNLAVLLGLRKPQAEE
jgi:ferric-dicitrate binding protein FerR (iron transport regulator)